MPVDYQPNPIVEELLTHGAEGAVRLLGFLGPSGEDGMVRLFHDLSLDSWVEFSEEDLLYVMEGEGRHSPSTAFVRPQSRLRYVARKEIAADQLTPIPNPPGEPNFPTLNISDSIPRGPCRIVTFLRFAGYKVIHLGGGGVIVRPVIQWAFGLDCRP